MQLGLKGELGLEGTSVFPLGQLKTRAVSRGEHIEGPLGPGMLVKMWADTMEGREWGGDPPVGLPTRFYRSLRLWNLDRGHSLRFLILISSYSAMVLIDLHSVTGLQGAKGVCSV